MPTKPYSQRIPSLHNGISTQAPSSRFPSQVADAENALFNVINGVSTRGGSRYFVTLDADASAAIAGSASDFKCHRIVRDASERYIVVYGRSTAGNMVIKVVDLMNPRNREQYFTLGSPSAGTYTISFAGQTTSSLAYNASAANVQTALEALSTIGSGKVSVVADGSWLVVSLSDTLPYTGLLKINPSLTGATIDGPYGTDCKVTGLSGAIQTYLNGGSAVAKDLRLLTIVDTTIIANSAVATGTTTSNQALDPAKLPIKMERTTLSPPTFALSQITWNAGSATKTAPVPMRMGTGGEKKIADVSYHRGRLCFAMDEWFVASQPDSLYNFFPYTADTTYNDSDPIVAQLGSSSVSVIDWVVPFRKSLLVLTRNGTQFEIGGGDTFTPKTATLTPSTTYATQSVKPAAISSFIYFAGVRENSSVVYEYAYDDVQVSYRASAITQHVDGLLPASIRSMAASDNNDTLIVVPGTSIPNPGSSVQSNALGGGKWSNPNTWANSVCPSQGHVVQIASGDVVTFDSYGTSSANLFVYRMLRVADKLVQSAWTKYTFNLDNIMDVAIVEDTAYIVRNSYQAAAGSGSSAANYRIVIDSMPIAADPSAPATFDEQPRLDHRRIVRGGTVASGVLSWRIDALDYDINTIAVQTNDVWTDYPATVTPVAGSTDALVQTTQTSLQNKLVVLGRKIPFKVTTTRLFRIDDQGNAIVEGELFINKIVTDHTNCGPYELVVSSSRRDDREFTFVPQSSIPGQNVNVEKYGRFSAWTPGRAQDMVLSIKNTTSIPVVITGIEFYGTHNTATEG